MSQLMPLPLTVSCFSKIQIGFTFLVLAHLGSPRKRAVKRVCVCVCVCMSSLSICAILLTVFDFSTYVVNKHLIILLHKKLCYHRETIQCTMSVEILPAAASLYENSHLKRLAIG